MANEFGGPSPASSFLVGLASSTMDAFKQDHDRDLAEDFQRKQIDYDLLMKAMKQVQDDDNLTPSQRNSATQEIMNRSLDIWKPKGHGAIKDRLKDMFGGGERYQPQGVGDILTKQRPKADVGVKIPEGQASFTNDGVTLPLPPRPAVSYTVPGAEQTFHEQARSEKTDDIDAVTNRQLAVQQARTQAQKDINTQKNTEWMKRNDIRDEAKATLKLRQLASAFGDPNDPDNLELARHQMQAEMSQKREAVNERMELQKARIKKIDTDIVNAKQRIEIANKGLSLRQQKQWSDNIQVQGAWKKVDQYKSEAQRLWSMAAIAHGKYVNSGYQDESKLAEAEDYERQAKVAEDSMQGVINNIETQQGQRQGGVTLPSAPTANENPKIRMYANKYFKGNYAAAEAYAKAHP